jgi:hypothetical protein
LQEASHEREARIPCEPLLAAIGEYYLALLVAISRSTCSIVGPVELGVGMPTLDWGRFLETHYRPHLVVVNLGTASDSASGRKQIALVERLAESLNTVAYYAVSRERHVIRVAFERDLDALTFGDALMGHLIERGGPEWASQSLCSLDPSTEHKMIAALKRAVMPAKSPKAKQSLAGASR